MIPLPGGPERGIYSYGDSAGFTPDFPFNDAGRQPNRREDSVFTLMIAMPQGFQQTGDGVEPLGPVTRRPGGVATPELEQPEWPTGFLYDTD
jgi:hypothetical protein